MSEWIELGPTPANEECAQVGSDDYHEQSVRETTAYRNQLIRAFPNARFKVKSFPHDFGTYREVCVWWDEHGAEAEENCPTEWDDTARKELGLD